MIATSRVIEIAKHVAGAHLKGSFVEDVRSEPASDSEGRDALRITIVISPEAVHQIDGESLLNTLVDLQNRLQREGEERLAIVEYATSEELAEVGDP